MRNIDSLDPERIPLALKEGFIEVDSRMRTSVPGIFAAGDVVGKGFFAHKAFQEGKTAVENILGRGDLDGLSGGFPSAFIPPLRQHRSVSPRTKQKMNGERSSREVSVYGVRTVDRNRTSGWNGEDHLRKKVWGSFGCSHPGSPCDRTDPSGCYGHEARDRSGGHHSRSIFAHPTFSEAFFEAALDTSGEAIHMMKG